VGASLARVLARHDDVAAAWLFGSFFRGEARADSDVDVALIFRTRGEDARKHHRLLGTIGLELEAALGGARVDLVVLEAQNVIFQHEVLRNGLLIYEADRARRIDFESTATSRYLDFRPTYDLVARRTVAGLRRWLDGR
jgi:predicted nucleotidyltransferase